MRAFGALHFLFIGPLLVAYETTCMIRYRKGYYYIDSLKGFDEKTK